MVQSTNGSKITDLDGKEYLDFSTGIGVMNIGHGQKEVLQTISDQTSKLQHICIHVATYEPYIALCEKLASLYPHGEQTKVFLLNSGAEVVENAIKVAKQATKRSGVLCYTEAFHARTMLGMSLTSKVGYKKIADH